MPPTPRSCPRSGSNCPVRRLGRSGLAPLLAVAGLAAAGCWSGDWVEVESAEGRFSVAMPDMPVEKTQSIRTVFGDVALRLFVLDRGSLSYMVGFSDYPEPILAASTPEKLLDGARDGAAVNIQGTVQHERPMKLGDNPGRSVTLRDSSGDWLLELRLFLVGRRLYQVGVATPRDERDSDDARRFFESFALLESSSAI